MLRIRWVGALVLVLGMGSWVEAQSINPTSFSRNGTTAANAVSRPFNGSNLGRSTIPTVNNLQSGPTFSITNFFRQLNPFASSGTVGSSNIPAPQYKDAFTPLPPINSTIPGR